MIMVEFLEVLGCAIAAFAIVVTIFEKEGKKDGKHEVRFR